jgi:hypothetical protein
MTHALPTPIERAWSQLAPKLIAFLATGLTASALIGVVQYGAPLLGLQIELKPELAAILVGIVSTVAAYIQRDNLLVLPPNQFAFKVLVFAASGISATGTLALFAQFGVDLSEFTPIITAGVTLLGAVLGYFKRDRYALPA